MNSIELYKRCIPFQDHLVLFFFPAYSVDEIEEKTKAYRASSNVAVQDDGTTLGVSILMYFIKLKLNLIVWLKRFSICFSVQLNILYLKMYCKRTFDIV